MCEYLSLADIILEVMVAADKVDCRAMKMKEEATGRRSQWRDGGMKGGRSHRVMSLLLCFEMQQG